jgi:hypothetical protein
MRPPTKIAAPGWSDDEADDPIRDAKGKPEGKHDDAAID